ncbi:MAG: SDR family oxidoreductase [Pseudomonadales bacterium]|nr:SDR family oxidoreductase [Pseudomonadales bacterium]
MQNILTDMVGKTCLVTGANAGIGFETAKGLATLGADLILVCRDSHRGEEARKQLIQDTGNDRIDLLIADMSLMDSVRNLADQVNQNYPHLHVLINNAGVMLSKRQLTAEGYEIQYAVHHLGPFLLTHLLLDKLKASSPARIINITSKMHTMNSIDFDNLQAEKKFGPFKTYAASKLANIMFTYSLAERLEGTGVTVNCLHPGVIGSNIGSTPGFIKVFMKSPHKGAETPLYLASAPELEVMNGKYFMDKKPLASSEESYDKTVAAKLWDLSMVQTGLKERKVESAA